MFFVIFVQILENAGYDTTQAEMIANDLCNSGDDYWAGYNLQTGQVTNMEEAGILDPTKVTCTALANAGSVAGTILLTECVVVDHPDQKEPTPDALY